MCRVAVHNVPPSNTPYEPTAISKLHSFQITVEQITVEIGRNEPRSRAVSGVARALSAYRGCPLSDLRARESVLRCGLSPPCLWQRPTLPALRALATSWAYSEASVLSRWMHHRLACMYPIELGRVIAAMAAGRDSSRRALEVLTLEREEAHLRPLDQWSSARSSKPGRLPWDVRRDGVAQCRR